MTNKREYDVVLFGAVCGDRDHAGRVGLVLGVRQWTLTGVRRQLDARRGAGHAALVERLDRAGVRFSVL